MNESNVEQRTPEQTALFAESVSRFIQDASGDVETFATQILDLKLPVVPLSLSGTRAEERMTLMREELKETEQAFKDNDFEEVVDGLIDLLYVTIGTLLEMGVSTRAAWGEVQRANMSKTKGANSKRQMRGCDAVKPEGWKAPDHSMLLGLSIEELRYAKYITGPAVPVSIHRALAIVRRKSHDYNKGGTESRDKYFPFGDESYLTHLVTKVNRLVSVRQNEKGGANPHFESKLDSVFDLINYASFYGDFLHKQHYPNYPENERQASLFDLGAL